MKTQITTGSSTDVGGYVYDTRTPLPNTMEIPNYDYVRWGYISVQKEDSILILSKQIEILNQKLEELIKKL